MEEIADDSESREIGHSLCEVDEVISHRLGASSWRTSFVEIA